MAELLFDSDATEAEIIPTLVLSERMGTLVEQRETRKRKAAARELLQEYPSVELVQLLSGFPVVRFRPVIPEVIRHPGSNLVRRVRLKALTRFVGDKEVADIYSAVLAREKLPVFGSSPGKIEWEYRDFQLAVDVGAINDIEPWRLHDFSEYPQVYRFSFPMATVVAKLLRALLGRGQKKNLLFGELLGDYGRGKDQGEGHKAAEKEEKAEVLGEENGGPDVALSVLHEYGSVVGGRGPRRRYDRCVNRSLLGLWRCCFPLLP